MSALEHQESEAEALLAFGPNRYPNFPVGSCVWKEKLHCPGEKQQEVLFQVLSDGLGKKPKSLSERSKKLKAMQIFLPLMATSLTSRVSSQYWHHIGLLGKLNFHVEEPGSIEEP